MKRIARIAGSFLLVIALSNQLKAQKTTGQQKQVEPKSVSNRISVQTESVNTTKPSKPLVPITSTTERSLPPAPTKSYNSNSGGAKKSGNAN